MAWRRELVLLALAACSKRAPAPLDPDRVPTVDDALAIDGEWHEPAWNARSWRRVLVGDDGAEARPYSEVRLLHDAANLYIGLYAADEDIRSTDAFDVAIGRATERFTADGRAEPALAVGLDLDGTRDQPDDYDEEWVIEAAIPIDRLGPPPYALSIARCDTTKAGARRCGSWRGTVRP